MKRYWAKPKDLFETLPKNYKEGYDCIRLMQADDMADLAKRVLKYDIDHEWSCDSTHMKGTSCDCGRDKLIAELEQIAGK